MICQGIQEELWDSFGGWAEEVGWAARIDRRRCLALRLGLSVDQWCRWLRHRIFREGASCFGSGDSIGSARFWRLGRPWHLGWRDLWKQTAWCLCLRECLLASSDHCHHHALLAAAEHCGSLSARRRRAQPSQHLQQAGWFTGLRYLHLICYDWPSPPCCGDCPARWRIGSASNHSLTSPFAPCFSLGKTLSWGHRTTAMDCWWSWCSESALLVLLRCLFQLWRLFEVIRSNLFASLATILGNKDWRCYCCFAAFWNMELLFTFYGAPLARSAFIKYY